jgi:cytochrome P450
MNSHTMRSDPPDHTRLRRLMSAALGPKRIEALRPRVEQIADECLNRLDGRAEADLIADFAFPVPINIICQLLGIPSEDRDRFRDWSHTFVAGVGAPVFPVNDVTAFVSYLRDLVNRKRERPDDALLSALIAARDDEDRLSEDELTSSVFLLIIAGHETTVNLIGNTLLTLLTEPERMAYLRAHPEQTPAVLDEVLRRDSPVPAAAMRVVTEDFSFAGADLRKGDLVMPSLASANRDAAVFPEPDEFRFDRGALAHVAFGHGIHYCIGAPLARMEAQITIDALLRRFPGLRLCGPEQPAWRPGIFTHGLAALPVALG